MQLPMQLGIAWYFFENRQKKGGGGIFCGRISQLTQMITKDKMSVKKNWNLIHKVIHLERKKRS